MNSRTVYRTVKWEPRWNALVRLANLPGDSESIRKFISSHPRYMGDGYAGEFSTMTAREYLRKLWLDRENANAFATALLCGTRTVAEIINSLAKAIAVGAEQPMSEGAALGALPFHADWFGQGIVYDYESRSQLQKDVYDLLKISDQAVVCGRYGRGCGTPLYVAPKLPHKYCSEECEAWGVRQSQDKYYAIKGKAKRQEREARKKEQSKRKGKR